MKTKETFELLRPIHESISKLFTISEVEEITEAEDGVDGVYKLYSCDILWLTIGYKITIDSIEYKITDIQEDEFIIVTGASLPVAQTITIYSSFFYHGTIIAQSQELDQVQFSWNKFPMTYLHEITRERFTNDYESSIERESDCDIYFMIDCNPVDWKTADHDKYAIKPMRKLMELFLDKLENYKRVGIINDYEVFDHAKWGIYITDKGHTKQIFKDFLSGVQLRITIPFLKDLTCQDC